MRVMALFSTSFFAKCLCVGEDCPGQGPRFQRSWGGGGGGCGEGGVGQFLKDGICKLFCKQERNFIHTKGFAANFSR